jgi:predicted RNA methylase
MLRDRVRTGAYRDAMMANAHRFKDAVVMDIGAGTGILSMFAAQVGAKKVYAVEASDMALKTRQIIATNGFADRIEVDFPSL